MMDEAAFELVKRFLLLVNGGEGRQVEVATVAQTDDSKLIHFLPRTTIEDTIAKGKEAVVLPTELGDRFSRFGGFVEELLEARQLFLFRQPDIVADTLDLLFETAQADEVFGLKLDDTFLMVLVLYLEETERR